MKRALWKSVALLALATLAWPAPAEAIPVFARKYSTQCTMCHSAFPRLNDFGTRFRDNGYRVPGRESEEQTVLESPPPFAARTSAGLNVVRTTEPGTPDLTQVQVNGLDILSAGLLHRRIGYVAIFVPPIPGMPGVAEQAGTLELANVVFSDVLVPGLSVRAGRFEPANVPFSVKRQLSVAPYEIYNLAFPGGSPTSEVQEGLEVSGHAAGYHAALGSVSGASTAAGQDFPLDLYFRFSKVLGAGEGQTAGQRLGVTAEFARARPLTTPPLPTAERQDSYRVGADASLNYAGWNLALQVLLISDAAALWGASERVYLWGGFAELSFQPMTSLVAFARFDGVKTPDFLADKGDIRRMTAGVRYYFANQFALHAEFSRRDGLARAPGVPASAENSGTLRLDVAF